jgi:hypothetical protein
MYDGSVMAVLGVSGGDDLRHPDRVRIGRVVAVAVAVLDCGDRTPEVVQVLHRELPQITMHLQGGVDRPIEKSDFFLFGAARVRQRGPAMPSVFASLGGITAISVM